MSIRDTAMVGWLIAQKTNRSSLAASQPQRSSGASSLDPHLATTISTILFGMPPKKRQRTVPDDPADSKGSADAVLPSLEQVDGVVGDLVSHLRANRDNNQIDWNVIQDGLLSLKRIQTTLLEDMRTTAEAAKVRRAAADKRTQQLAALTYEQKCLTADLQECRNFQTPNLERLVQDEQAASLQDLVQANPDDASARSRIVAFLQQEIITARGRLEGDCQAQEKKLSELQDAVKKKKAFLASLPNHVASMERASLSLQKTMLTQNDSPQIKELRMNSTDRRARLEAARNLSLPLYTLFVSLQNYVDQQEQAASGGATISLLSLTVQADPNKREQAQVVSLHIPMIDPLSAANSRPKKMTVQFQYVDGVVTAVVSNLSGAMLASPRGAVLQHLFPDSTEEKGNDDITTSASFTWSNYLAGLPQVDRKDQPASVRAIVRVLCRRLRANVTLKAILTSWQRHQMPLLPVEARLSHADGDNTQDNEAYSPLCQIASCSSAATATDALDTLQVVLRKERGSERLTIQVALHKTRYPEVAPQWTLNTGESENNDKSLYDERLATMETKANVALLSLVEQAGEVAQEWILVHQLHSIMKDWDDW